MLIVELTDKQNIVHIHYRTVSIQKKEETTDMYYNIAGSLKSYAKQQKLRAKITYCKKKKLHIV
jgi:hypothetical protein